VSTADASPISEAEASALFADLTEPTKLLLAVSGGPDSMALLHLATRWRAGRRSGPTLLAATVDHGLRPDSAQEASSVQCFSLGRGVAHRTLCWRGEKPQTGLQEAAREARYALLAEAARAAGASHILTAHTRDDQAETVLFRLARGSGLAGLAGMARATRLDDLVTDLVLARPLLDVPKARLIATLRAAGIGFFEDPSNQDPRFARVRLRALMPALAAEGLDAARLARLAQRLRRADVALEAAAAAALARVSIEGDSGALAIDAEAFAQLPVEIALRILHHVIAQNGRERAPELAKLEVLLDALRAARSAPKLNFRRTLAGAVVTLAADRLMVAPAPPRRHRGPSGRVHATAAWARSR
jgi:tRNA(Ile)-lysidine synthase